jgi:transposase-like protein
MIKVGGRHKKPAPVCKLCVAQNNRDSKQRLKSPERTRKNTLYMREYRARKKEEAGRGL